MKKAVLIIGALLLTMSFIFADTMEPVNLLREQIVNTSNIVRENQSRFVPDYAFHVNPLSIMPSWYDYFPGAYESIPIRVQPSPAGIYDGGGVYIAFQATPAAGGVRRVYYVYIEDGSITSGPSLIDLTGTAAEGFPGIDIDWETGDPFVSWHTVNPDNTLFYMCPLTFDQYSLIGTPGLWNTRYGVLNNPYNVGDEVDQEFIWPGVFVGPSPNTGQRRVYIVGKNFSSNVHGNPCENSLIAFADFSDPTDLSTFDEDQWTYITVPQLDNWRQDNIRPFRATIVSRRTGHVAIVGHTADLTEGSVFSPNDYLFVVENDNYGEGEWTLHTTVPTIPVDNPDDYFIGDSNLPYEDMRYGPYVNRHNTVVDEEGNYHFIAVYSLSTEENTWYPNMTTTKHIKFLRNTEEFVVTDLYPRNDDGSFYLPWSIPPTYDGDGYMEIEVSFPVYWYGNDEIFHENYHRIIQDGPRMVALFQESMKAKMFNEFGDDTYAAWASAPETYIMLSDDYGTTWSDPIILNSIETSEMAGLIPAYWYIADNMEPLGNDWYRLHFLFYSQNDYGSYIQGIGPNSGGNVMYTSIDFDFGGLSADDDYVAVQPTQMLKQNYPNPFNPSTTISFNLPSTMNVTLEIYNVKGQVVKTLVEGTRPAGENFIIWNGTDNSNSSVGSGVYFYKLTSDSHQEMRKMLLVK